MIKLQHYLISLGLIWVLALPLVAQEEDEIEIVIWAEPGTADCINDTESTLDFCYYARMMNDTWHEMHPNVRLVWENHGWDVGLLANLEEALAEGEGPDIVVGESFMPQLVREGVLAPLDLPEDVREDLIPATVEAVMLDDELYGVAAFTAVFTLEVNGDVLRIAGIEPEVTDFSTWENVLEIAETVAEEGRGDFYGFSILGPTPNPIGAFFRVVPYVYQTGADFCTQPDCTEPTLNDPRVVQVYEWFRDLYATSDPELVFNGDEGVVFTQLFSGFAGMQTAGAWHIAWAESSGCEDCRYYPLPLPEDGVQANVVVGNAMYAVLESSEHVEEATEVLEFMVSDTVQNAVFWTGGSGRLPTTYSAVEALQEVMEGDTASVPEFYTEELQFQLEDAPEVAEQYDVYLNELAEGDVRTLPPWPNEVTVIWNEMFAEVLTSDEPVEDILDRYQAEAEEIMAAEED